MAPRQRSSRLAEAASGLLARGRLAVVATERSRDPDLVDASAQRRIAEALATVADRVPAGVLIAKGGITAAVTASHGLHAATARVIGPLLPGVSYWRLDRGQSYVVVPGNVGDAAPARRPCRPAGRRLPSMTTAFERLFADRAAQAAVGAFTCYDLETAAAVLRVRGTAQHVRDPPDRRAIVRREGWPTAAVGAGGSRGPQRRRSMRPARPLLRPGSDRRGARARGRRRHGRRVEARLRGERGTSCNQPSRAPRRSAPASRPSWAASPATRMPRGRSRLGR